MEIPYPYSMFPKQSVPVPFYVPQFDPYLLPYPYPYLIFKKNRTRHIYAPQNQNLPVLRTFYVSVPRYDCLNVDALPLRTSDSGRTHSHIIASTARRRTQKIKENIEINYQAIGIGKTFFFNKLDLSSYNYKKKYPSKNGLQLAQSLIVFEIN